MSKNGATIDENCTNVVSFITEKPTNDGGKATSRLYSGKLKGEFKFESLPVFAVKVSLEKSGKEAAPVVDDNAAGENVKVVAEVTKDGDAASP